MQILSAASFHRATNHPHRNSPKPQAAPLCFGQKQSSEKQFHQAVERLFNLIQSYVGSSDPEKALPPNLKKTFLAYFPPFPKLKNIDWHAIYAYSLFNPLADLSEAAQEKKAASLALFNEIKDPLSDVALKILESPKLRKILGDQVEMWVMFRDIGKHDALALAYEKIYRQTSSTNVSQRLHIAFLIDILESNQSQKRLTSLQPELDRMLITQLNHQKRSRRQNHKLVPTLQLTSRLGSSPIIPTVEDIFLTKRDFDTQWHTVQTLHDLAKRNIPGATESIAKLQPKIDRFLLRSLLKKGPSILVTSSFGKDYGSPHWIKSLKKEWSKLSEDSVRLDVALMLYEIRKEGNALQKTAAKEAFQQLQPEIDQLLINNMGTPVQIIRSFDVNRFLLNAGKLGSEAIIPALKQIQNHGVKTLAEEAQNALSELKARRIFE